MIKFDLIKANEAVGWRRLYTQVLTELARCDVRVMYVCADLGRACDCATFESEFPERFFNFGIAEQNAVSGSAGLASFGNVVFFSTFAPFASMRALEQIRADCAYMHLPVRVVGTDCGIAMTALGNTHYGIEDMGVTRAIPELTVIAPSDGLQMARLMECLLDYEGAVYMRIGGSTPIHSVYTADRDFAIGKAVMLRNGGDVTIAACGNMMSVALDAAALLESMGISAAVLDIHTIKPLDAEAIEQAAAKTGLIATVEEHCVTGGLGSAVADIIAAYGAGQVMKFGLPDQYLPTVASYEEKMEELGLTADAIARGIANMH